MKCSVDFYLLLNKYRGFYQNLLIFWLFEDFDIQEISRHVGFKINFQNCLHFFLSHKTFCFFLSCLFFSFLIFSFLVLSFLVLSFLLFCFLFFSFSFLVLSLLLFSNFPFRWNRRLASVGKRNRFLSFFISSFVPFTDLIYFRFFELYLVLFLLLSDWNNVDKIPIHLIFMLLSLRIFPPFVCLFVCLFLSFFLSKKPTISPWR